MYRSLAFDDHASNHPEIFSITQNGSPVEKINGFRTSKRTLILCSLALIMATGVVATWIFLAKPHFYPAAKVRMLKRSSQELASKLDKAIQDVATNSGKISRVRRATRKDDVIRVSDVIHVSPADSAEMTQNSKSEVQFKSNSSTFANYFGDHNMSNRRTHAENDGDTNLGDKLSHADKTKVQVILNPTEFPYKDSRLPITLTVEEYFISVDIDLEKDVFPGSVRMVLRCRVPTDKIVFHGRDIYIFFVNVTADSKTQKIRRVSQIKRWNMFVVEMERELEKERIYEVFIQYEAKFGQSLAGLYKSKYKTKSGGERVIASTHFEPADARSVFPCLDEPAFKARFHISITHDESYNANSNMPVKKLVQRGDGKIETQFQTSVVMSTYLVALTVNDFVYHEEKTEGGVVVRTYARELDKNRIAYATQAGAKIISFYEDFFGAKYPLPKLDMIAVPDFLAGAMEDWGLVSFRSAYLVFDEKLMTVESKRQVTLVIAHELAHQWFGNLVTMKWWNDIWLNEGFANFVEMFGTDHVNPEFRALDMQVVTGWQSAISLDSLKNSHPVSQPVKSNHEIEELFDSISYNKGASLLRMVDGFMGKLFIAGVKSYIQDHKFGNAETDDLWTHLAKARVDEYNFNSIDPTGVQQHLVKSGEYVDVKGIMDTWTDQRGFPLLTVERINDTAFTVSQESIISVISRIAEKSKSQAKDTVKKSEYPAEQALWQIPFTFITDESSDSPKLVWIKKERKTTFQTNQKFSWIKANLKSRGFYLVNYDNATWWNLIKQLKDNHKVFTDVDRAGIIHDAFKLACEEILDPIIVMEMTRYLTREKDYIPWAMVRAKYDCISLLMTNKTKKLHYKKYIWRIQSHLVKGSMLDTNTKTNGNDLSLFDKLQRYDAFVFALKHNFRKDFKEKLRRIFIKLRDGADVSTVTPEIRALTLMFGYNTKSLLDWNYLWQLYAKSEVDSDRKLIMKAFAQFKRKEKVDQLLNNSLDLKMMRIQDTIPMLTHLVRVNARRRVYDFIVKNYEQFKKRYSGGYQLGQLFSEVAGGFNTQPLLDAVRAFLKEHPIGHKDSRTERQILEKIESNIVRRSSKSSRARVKSVEDWVERELAKTTSRRKV